MKVLGDAWWTPSSLGQAPGGQSADPRGTRTFSRKWPARGGHGELLGCGSGRPFARAVFKWARGAPNIDPNKQDLRKKAFLEISTYRKQHSDDSGSGGDLQLQASELSLMHVAATAGHTAVAQWWKEQGLSPLAAALSARLQPLHLAANGGPWVLTLAVSIPGQSTQVVHQRPGFRQQQPQATKAEAHRCCHAAAKAMIKSFQSS